MSSPPRELAQRLTQHGQAHLVRFWPELSAASRARLTAELESLDLPLVARLGALARGGGAQLGIGSFAPPDVFRPRAPGVSKAELAELRARGGELLRAGRVGCVLVAGGQASRLGYDAPKGVFPVGPVSGRSLFEIFARKLHAASERFGRTLPWYVLTSEANDAATRAFFERHAFFGLPPGEIFFMRQAMLPALDDQGRILMAARDALFLAPNGHGGVLAALAASGALEHARARGVDLFSYWQVDNPLAQPADTLFLGLHAQRGAQMSSKVVRKRDASEKVGVLGRADGQLTCIEYSDLPPELREKRDEHGELVYGDGNIAVHALDRTFVEGLTERGFALPWHLARKRVTALDDAGERRELEAWKFESFVFDALGFAGGTSTLEVERSDEFSPVKNAEGLDSPRTARADLCRLHASWVRAAGLALPPPDEHGVFPVEVDPCLAEDVHELRARLPLTPRVLPTGHFYGPKKPT
jgi:UDP-N-acetylglucosamine/UDP-N-acetylgalactosamine diphosphorylase